MERTPLSCCVKNGTNQLTNSSGIKFFRFPKSELKRTAGINAVRRKDWTPSEFLRVCIVYFSSGMKLITAYSLF